MSFNLKIENLLDKTGLSDKKDAMPETLSGGQKQRCEFSKFIPVVFKNIFIFNINISRTRFIKSANQMQQRRFARTRYTMYNSKCYIANIVKFNMGKLKSCYKINILRRTDGIVQKELAGICNIRPSTLTVMLTT